MFQGSDVREIQKFIWLLLVLVVIAKVFPFLRDLYLARTYAPGEIPLSVVDNFQFISLGLVALQNVASALWLRYLAFQNGVGTIVWSAFGLLFGLIAVAILYLASMYERQKT